MASLPDWLDPLPDAGEQRALDEWAIGERGHPGHRADGARRAPGWPIWSASWRLPAGWPSCAVRATTAATGWWPRACCASGGATSTCCCSARPRSCAVTPRRICERLPGPARGVVRRRRAGGRGRDRRRDPRHGVLGRAARARRGRDRGDQPAPAPAARSSSPATFPAGSTPRPERSPAMAVRARATATFHAAKPGLWIDPGKTHAGEVRVIDIGIPPGGPGRCRRSA